MKIIREIGVPGRWCLHSYYTMRPYAPDGSGRLLLAGADLKSRLGKIFVIAPDGSVADEFGEHPVESSFFHTGFWQTWSPDCRFVYFQSGTLSKPTITRRELSTGKEITLDGDSEGFPPLGEPTYSGLLGMLYAAGYGYGVYNPSIAPVPFEARDKHGVFEYGFEPAYSKLRLSVAEILESHPGKDALLKLDKELSALNGTPAGLTLMCYCVRWNFQGTRLLFHFGNHCVVKGRKEPKVTAIFTCKRDFTDIHMALDLQRGGVHWSWHPDGERLVGYAKLPEQSPGEPNALSIVRYDGTGLRRLCGASGGGHPSVSPANFNLAATDNGSNMEFWDIGRQKLIERQDFRNSTTGVDSGLRNETRVCHHPVFSTDGKKVLFNVIDGHLSHLVEVESPEV